MKEANLMLKLALDLRIPATMNPLRMGRRKDILNIQGKATHLGKLGTQMPVLENNNSQAYWKVLLARVLHEV